MAIPQSWLISIVLNYFRTKSVFFADIMNVSPMYGLVCKILLPFRGGTHFLLRFVESDIAITYAWKVKPSVFIRYGYDNIIVYHRAGRISLFSGQHFYRSK